jgi:hypothetical protein
MMMKKPVMGMLMNEMLAVVKQKKETNRFIVVTPTKACNLCCVGCYADSSSNCQKLDWLVPCPIRDHNAEFRSWLREYEPDPVDENAAQALMDPDYACGMDAYDAAYQALSGEIWEEHYLSERNNGGGEVKSLPQIDSLVDKESGA